MLTDVERKKSQCARTRKHREKVKGRAEEQVATAEQRRKKEFDDWRRRDRLAFPGELEAFQDAQNCSDALIVAREYILALGQPDVQAGETLLDVERRVVSAWVEQGAPLLNRNTLRLDTSVASTADGYTFDFDTQWVPIDGANEVIDISTLPVIEVPAAVDSPTVEVAPTIEDIAAKELAIRVATICKAQQDRCDAEGRRISARNEQRELEKEKRLGVAYAYDAE
jgi:hypothetical protein